MVSTTTLRLPIPSTAQHSPKAASLLALPLEIRNQIWTYIFQPSTNEETVTIYCVPRHIDWPRLSAPWHKVCKQLHQEQIQMLKLKDKKAKYIFIQEDSLPGLPIPQEIFELVRRQLSYPSIDKISFVITMTLGKTRATNLDWLKGFVQLARARSRGPRWVSIQVDSDKHCVNFKGFDELITANYQRFSVVYMWFEIDVASLKVRNMVLEYRRFGPDREPESTKFWKAQSKALESYLRTSILGPA